MVRCKVVCMEKTEAGDLRFLAVTDGSEENKQFFQATPTGEINLLTTNPAAAEKFEAGKEYYVDFTAAEKVESAADKLGGEEVQQPV